MWLGETDYKVLQNTSERNNGGGFIIGIVQLFADTKPNASVREQ
jgi:hypothetical protein